jgi:hypothetical protein
MEWRKLQKLARASKNNYLKTFSAFLDEDKAQRDFLLGFLVKHHQNVVDNLTTKEDLTFAEVKQRLMDMSSNLEGSPETALNTTQNKGKQKNKKNKKTDKKTEVKDCTWCVKHNPGKSCGHSWNDCFCLKKHNEEKKKESKDVAKKEEANVTTENQQVRTKSFYFDTVCTSHMTPFPERFQNFKTCFGLVESSSKQQMEIKGKGDIVMDCVLRNGSVCTFRIHDVLYVPQLGKALISWRKLRNQYKKNWRRRLFYGYERK